MGRAAEVGTGLQEGVAEATSSLWPLGVWTLMVVGLVAVVLVLSQLLGPRHAARRRDLPYESGMPATGGVHLRFPIHFYLIAIAFLVFDLEAVYLFAWAVAAREVGWVGYVEALVFTVMLFAGLVFLWGKGALDWVPRPTDPTAAERVTRPAPGARP